MYSFSNKRDRTQLAVGVSKPYTYILGGKYKKVDDKYIRTFLSLQKQVPFFEVMLNTFNQRTSMGSTDALSIIYRDIIITLFRDMLWNEESELLQYTRGTFAEVENFNYTLEKIVEKYNWGENF